VSGRRTAGCHRIFEETASGGRWDRPKLHRMLDQLRKGTAASLASSDLRKVLQRNLFGESASIQAGIISLLAGKIQGILPISPVEVPGAGWRFRPAG
jgi:hypothetical protein